MILKYMLYSTPTQILSAFSAIENGRYCGVQLVWEVEWGHWVHGHVDPRGQVEGQRDRGPGLFEHARGIRRTLYWSQHGKNGYHGMTADAEPKGKWQQRKLYSLAWLFTLKKYTPQWRNILWSSGHSMFYRPRMPCLWGYVLLKYLFAIQNRWKAFTHKISAISD